MTEENKNESGSQNNPDEDKEPFEDKEDFEPDKSVDDLSDEEKEERLKGFPGIYKRMKEGKEAKKELKELKEKAEKEKKEKEEKEKKEKEEKGEEKKEEKEKMPSAFDLAKTVSALKDYSSEEIDFIHTMSKAKNISPEEVIKDPDVQLFIKAKRDKVAKEKKIPDSGSPGGKGGFKILSKAEIAEMLKKPDGEKLFNEYEKKFKEHKAKKSEI